jgi:ABC-type phosphate transport system substrate-binding protein
MMTVVSRRARAHALALALACASGALAGLGLATPGSALALACAETKGSGSTLQNIAQRAKGEKSTGFIEGFAAEKGLRCESKPTIRYNEFTSGEKTETNGSGSGSGLEEFGLEETQSNRAINREFAYDHKALDGFVGTEAAPTQAAMEGSGATNGVHPIVVPIGETAIALVGHTPEGCKFRLKESNQPDPSIFGEWASKFKTWREWLEQLKPAPLEIIGCEERQIHEVLAEPEGTTLAFKKYLADLEPTMWEKFINGRNEWPEVTEAKAEHEELVGKAKLKVRNEGNVGEALAIKDTPGAIGYVDLADAVAMGFAPYVEKDGIEGNTIFWDKVQSSQKEVGDFAEPVAEGALKNSNCPKEFSLEAKQKEEAEKGNWSHVFLENPSPPQPTSYPLCTFMYDIGWKSYKGLKSKTEKYPEGVGNTVSQYLTFEAGVGQKDIENLASYNGLPKNIDELAKIAAEGVAE